MIRRFLWAIRRRCPNCGYRGVVRRWRVADDCPECRHHYERHEGYWLGAIAINTVVTIGLFAAALVGSLVLTWPDPPWTAITIGVVALNLAFPIIFYPWSKLLWMALDLGLHAPEPGQSRGALRPDARGIAAGPTPPPPPRAGGRGTP